MEALIQENDQLRLLQNRSKASQKPAVDRCQSIQLPQEVLIMLGSGTH